MPLRLKNDFWLKSSHNKQQLYMVIMNTCTILILVALYGPNLGHSAQRTLLQSSMAGSSNATALPISNSTVVQVGANMNAPGRLAGIFVGSSAFAAAVAVAWIVLKRCGCIPQNASCCCCCCCNMCSSRHQPKADQMAFFPIETIPGSSAATMAPHQASIIRGTYAVPLPPPSRGLFGKSSRAGMYSV